MTDDARTERDIMLAEAGALKAAMWTIVGLTPVSTSLAMWMLIEGAYAFLMFATLFGPLAAVLGLSLAADRKLKTVREGNLSPTVVDGVDYAPGAFQ